MDVNVAFFLGVGFVVLIGIAVYRIKYADKFGKGGSNSGSGSGPKLP